jgi:hypothetical protein
MNQDWITRAMQRTDATARPGSDRNIPDTTSPKMAATAIKLQVLANAGELYHILPVMVSGQTLDSARIMIILFAEVVGAMRHQLAKPGHLTF